MALMGWVSGIATLPTSLSALISGKHKVRCGWLGRPEARDVIGLHQLCTSRGGDLMHDASSNHAFAVRPDLADLHQNQQALA